ncbi:MAG: hypothetical protein VW122_13155, partial [Paracoccaceae bacterium]
TFERLLTFSTSQKLRTLKIDTKGKFISYSIFLNPVQTCKASVGNLAHRHLAFINKNKEVRDINCAAPITLVAPIFIQLCIFTKSGLNFCHL